MSMNKYQTNQIDKTRGHPYDWSYMFSGDMIIARGSFADVRRAIKNAQSGGFEFSSEPFGKNFILTCNRSPNDKYLSAWRLGSSSKPYKTKVKGNVGNDRKSRKL